MKALITSLIITFTLFTTNVMAAVIVGPVAGTASSEFSSSFDIGNTFDQSGLSISYTSGVDDFDAYLALGPTHSYVAIDNEWFTPQESAFTVQDATVVRLPRGNMPAVRILATADATFHIQGSLR